jgi:hypothetical protein
MTTAYRVRPLPAPAPLSSPTPDISHCTHSPCGAHWWMIAPPSGPTSKGRCRYCGAVQRFVNYIEVRFKDGGRELTTVPSLSELNEMEDAG